MHDRNDEFDEIVQGFNATPAGNIDPNPYGTHFQQRKSGLTTRGKAALGIGAAIVAGGTLIGYQIHENDVVKEQEIALQSQQLQLAQQRETDQVNEASQKAQAAQVQARQASVDTCVKNAQAGNNTSYLDAVNACQNQYPGAVNSNNMQTTAATQSSGGSAVQGALILGGLVVVFVVVAAKKGTRSNQA